MLFADAVAADAAYQHGEIDESVTGIVADLESPLCIFPREGKSDRRLLCEGCVLRVYR